MSILLVLALFIAAFVGLCGSAMLPLSIATAGLAITLYLCARRRSRTRLVLVGAAAALLLLLLSANWLFLDPIARWALSRAAASAGMTLSIDRVSGNIWTGEIAVQHLRASVAAGRGVDYEVTVESAAVDVSMRSLVRSVKIVESLRVRGVRGRIDRVGSLAQPTDLPRFEIHDVTVADVRIEFYNRLEPARPLTTTLELSLLEISTLRSSALALDLLLASPLNAKAGGAPVEIRSAGPGGPIQWRAQNLPLSFLATFTGSPLTWLTEGSVDADIRGELQPSGDVLIRWKTIFSGLRADIPADAPLKQRLFWPPLLAFINKHGSRLPVEFEVAIPQQELLALANGDGNRFWHLLTQALVDAIGRSANIPLADTAGRAVEGVVDWWHHR